MDFRMSGMNGVDAFRGMQEVQPEIGVILTTAYTRTDDLTPDMDRIGVAGVLSKPCAVERLFEMIDADN